MILIPRVFLVLFGALIVVSWGALLIVNASFHKPRYY
jgi:hypothetical protein